MSANFELSRGIAYIIDDQIGKEEQIDKIIAKIRDKRIPTSVFTDLRSAELSLPHMIMANFLVLDWKMFNIPGEAGEMVNVGSVARASAVQQVIDFINKFKAVCFSPIFIFTTESESDIRDQIIPKLKEAKIYFDEEEKNFIHVRNKTDILKGDKLFKCVDKWIKSTPSVYVLKSWQKEFLKRQNEVFWDLYNKSASWPIILWKNFEDESEEPNSCMNETLFRLVLAGAELSIDKKIIAKSKTKPNLEEIKEVIRRTRFQEKNTLRGIKPGDIYKKQQEYFLNIRPECDTVAGRPHSEAIYLIKGKKISGKELKSIHHKHGFIPRVNEALVFFLDGKDAVKFDFRAFSMEIFEAFQRYRICRLLPPFITEIQHKFASFIGRYGIIRLPKKVELEILK